MIKLKDGVLKVWLSTTEFVATRARPNLDLSAIVNGLETDRTLLSYTARFGGRVHDTSLDPHNLLDTPLRHLTFVIDHRWYSIVSARGVILSVEIDHPWCWFENQSAIVVAEGSPTYVLEKGVWKGGPVPYDADPDGNALCPITGNRLFVHPVTREYPP